MVNATIYYWKLAKLWNSCDDLDDAGLAVERQLCWNQMQHNCIISWQEFGESQEECDAAQASFRRAAELAPINRPAVSDPSVCPSLFFDIASIEDYWRERQNNLDQAERELRIGTWTLFGSRCDFAAIQFVTSRQVLP